MRYYSKDHEWVDVADDIATLGITNYAQEQLGDIVFVELPETGAELGAGKEAAVVESVKAASDVFTPASGTVVEINATLADDPALVNSAPESDGWFFRFRLSNRAELDGLMDADAYAAWVATL